MTPSCHLKPLPGLRVRRGPGR